MNRSKLIGATALASVMAAGAAHAEMSISGLFVGKLVDNDGGGLSQGVSTNSIYVSYSDSMDNGMGVSASMSVTGTSITTDINFDTGMGTIGLGTGQDSAVDGFDGSPACFSLNLCGSAWSGKKGGAGLYNDGDTASGNSIAYSNSMGGVSFKVTRGMESTDNEAVMSYAASTSIMGATVKAGVSQIDNKGATADVDPSFVTVGYSLAGLSLGYAMYDGDNGGEETQMGVGTSLMGMDVGVTFMEHDATADTDYTLMSISKGMGAASFGIDYTETDAAGNADDADAWQVTYVVGF